MAFILMFARKEFENFLDKDYLKNLNVTPVIKKHKVLNEVNKFIRAIYAAFLVMDSKVHTDHDAVFTDSNT